jgi:hypothetical protein
VGDDQYTETDARLTAFTNAVTRCFEFLLDLGYVVRHAQPGGVEYASPQTVVVVSYGLRSGEVYVAIGPSGQDRPRQLFSTYEIALVEAPADAVHMDGRPVRSAAEIEVAVERHASWTRQFAQRALRGDHTVFAEVAIHRGEDSRRYMEEMEARRIRLRADEAWAARDMAGVAEALRRLLELSTVHPKPSELAKLRFAERQASREG